VDVADEDRVIANPHEAAVGAEQAVLGYEVPAGFVRGPVLLDHPLAVVRMQHVDPDVGTRHPLRGRDPKDLFGLRAGVDVAADAIDAVDVHDRG
jgi:hypothetical protein